MVELAILKGKRESDDQERGRKGRKGGRLTSMGTVPEDNICKYCAIVVETFCRPRLGSVVHRGGSSEVAHCHLENSWGDRRAPAFYSHD